MSKLIVFAAPSGAGKTTIVHHLLGSFDNLAFSVSATTRARRQYETDGQDYYFLTIEDFRQHIDQGDFVEWEEVYPDQFYGTLKSEIERLWNLGKHILFDIDVVGAINIREVYPQNSLTVFVKPPSLEVLEERLRRRETESAATIRKRMEKAAWEMEFENKFDRILVNDVLADTLSEACQIVAEFIQ